MTKENNTHLLCLPGWELRSPRGFEAQANAVYNLIRNDNIDGIVISSGVLGNFISLEELKQFCEFFKPLPMASIGVNLAPIPSVMVRNAAGITQVMDHVIQAHNKRKIVYIRGPAFNTEEQQRFEGYLEGLKRNSIRYRDSLVSPQTSKHWEEDSGMEAMQLLLSKRRLRPGVDFDAIIAGSDSTAFGALAELQKRGIDVPDKVILTGFDNQTRSGRIFPSLTTVNQSLVKQGREAVDLVLRQLRGLPVPTLTEIDPVLVIRRSCGCMDPAVLKAGETALIYFEHGTHPIGVDNFALADQIYQSLDPKPLEINPEHVLDLVNTFLVDLNTITSTTFLPALEQVLARATDILEWQRAITTLRHFIRPRIKSYEALSRAEVLWNQARVMIGEYAQRSSAYHRMRADQQASALLEVNQTLVTDNQTKEIIRDIENGLEQLQIPGCQILLYTDIPPRTTSPQPTAVISSDQQHGAPSRLWANQKIIIKVLQDLRNTLARHVKPVKRYKLFHLFLRQSDSLPNQASGKTSNEAIPPNPWLIPFFCKGTLRPVRLRRGKKYIDIKNLNPRQMFPTEQPHVLIAESLYFRKIQRGFVFFDLGPTDSLIYSSLAGHISSALHNVALFKQKTDLVDQISTFYVRSLEIFFESLYLTSLPTQADVITQSLDKVHRLLDASVALYVCDASGSNLARLASTVPISFRRRVKKECGIYDTNIPLLEVDESSYLWGIAESQVQRPEGLVIVQRMEYQQPFDKTDKLCFDLLLQAIGYCLRTKRNPF